MKLSKYERWVLSNQYRILEAVLPKQADEFAHAREVLENGYELEYGWVSQHVCNEVMTEEACREVRNILEMFNELSYAYGQLADRAGIEEHWVHFPGFYGNTEPLYLGYARHVLSDKDQFPRVRRRNDLDSHAPLLPHYRMMIAAWRQSASQAQLTHSDLVRITNVKPD